MIIIKKNGTKEKWIDGKIKKAIEAAMKETEEGINEKLSKIVEAEVKEIFVDKEEININELQTNVEMVLMHYAPLAAKRYILYRYEQSKLPMKKKENKIWTKHKHDDNNMDTLGEFVFNRTYARYLESRKRREEWWETSSRAVKYNTELDKNLNDKRKIDLLEHVFNHKIFLSGRTLWTGGGEIGELYPMSNFNCSFEIINNLKAFKDLFYLLMIGSGVGIRILPEDVIQIPSVRNDIRVIHEEYTNKAKEERIDHTSLIFVNNKTARITIGDSKEGWVRALEIFFEILSSIDYRLIDEVIINYDNVRGKGEKLKKFGGTASGYEPLMRMFKKIYKTIQKYDAPKTKLKTIDCLDIANIIGENVVSGGVRRTAEIMLIDANDIECIEAKKDLYSKESGEWVLNKDLSHRQVSNNSIFYKSKPSREKMNWQIDQMRYNGEPAFINVEAATRRKASFQGVNPCAEILLESKGLCNLTTIVVDRMVKNGKLSKEEVLYAAELAVNAAYRLTLLELELPEWDNTHKRDVIVGLSITGWQDMVNITNMSKQDQIILLKEIKERAINSINDYADKLGKSRPSLVTTVKPEGTQSQMSGSSSGLHFSHSEYYIRRIRISSDDALAKVCEELNYPMFPEVGQDWDTCDTKVVEFPQKAPAGKTKNDVSAIEQLEIYKMFMTYYVDHNASITVHVRDEEWDQVKEWMWDNWDYVVGISFLPLSDASYELLPYEEITEEEYNKRVSEMKPFRTSLIAKYETTGVSNLDNVKECESGICPIR